MKLEVFVQPTIIWFLIGLVLFIIEFIAPGIVALFFSIGACSVALVTLFLPISLPIQLAIFIIVSLLSLFLLRYRFIQSKSGIMDVTDDFYGKTAIVETAFTKGEIGKVRFKGANWRAITDSETKLNKGSSVKIINCDSITLIVEPIEK